MIVRAVRGLPTVPFRYRDRDQMAALGRSSAVAQIGPARISGWIGWMLWVFVHIGALIGFQNRFPVMSRWALTYFSDAPGARILLEAPKEASDQPQTSRREDARHRR